MSLGFRCYVLMKRGYFYRPYAKGYTSRISEAGRYTFDECRVHISDGEQPVTAHRISDFADMLTQENKIELLKDTLSAAEARVKRLEKGLYAVECLIMDSHGVAGLHLNSQVAPWHELRTGGRYEDWLIDFDAALAEAAPVAQKTALVPITIAQQEAILKAGGRVVVQGDAVYFDSSEQGDLHEAYRNKIYEHRIAVTVRAEATQAEKVGAL